MFCTIMIFQVQNGLNRQMHELSVNQYRHQILLFNAFKSKCRYYHFFPCLIPRNLHSNANDHVVSGIESVVLHEAP